MTTRRKRLPFVQSQASMPFSDSPSFHPDGSPKDPSSVGGGHFASIPNHILPRAKSSTWQSLERLIHSDTATAELARRPSLSLAVEPKVLLPYVPRVGETPRRVEIERRKALYSTQKLESLLLDHGISCDESSGVISIKLDDGRSVTLTQSQLKDLAMFDNTEFEERSLDTWLRLGDVGSGKLALLLPCRALVGCSWIDGHVVSYSHSDDLFVFKCDSLKEDVRLPRVCLGFVAESPTNYARRLSYALLSAAYHAAEVQDRALISVKLEGLEPQVRLFRDRLPGKVSTFSRNAQEFKKRFLYNDLRIHNLVLSFRNCLDQVTARCSLPLSHNALPSPDVWLQESLTMINDRADYVKIEWINSSRVILLQTLGSMGKGWYNVDENQYDVYRMSKMSNLMILVRLFVQDCFNSSILDFSSRIEDAMKQSTHASIMSMSVILGEGRRIALDFDSHQLCSIFDDFVDSHLDIFAGVPQLEQMIMSKLIWPSRIPFCTLTKVDDVIVKCKRSFNARISETHAALARDLREFERFRDRIFTSADDFMAVNEAKVLSMNVSDLKKEVAELRRDEKSILNGIPTCLRNGLIQVDMAELRRGVTKKWDLTLVQMIIARLTKDTEDGINASNSLIDETFKEPKTIEEVTSLRHFLSDVMDEHKKMSAQARDTEYFMDLISELSFDVPSKLRESNRAFEKNIKKLPERSEAKINELKAGEVNLFKSLQADLQAFAERFAQLKGIVAGFKTSADLQLLNDSATESFNIAAEARECVEAANLINSREKLFDLQPSDYSEAVQLAKEFEPFNAAWSAAKIWRDNLRLWRTGPFTQIDPDFVETTVNDLNKSLTKSIKQFGQFESYMRMASAIKREIDQFSPSLAVIQGLRNPGMRSRHWDDLTSKIGFRIDATSVNSFQELEEKSITAHATVIQAVSDFASKEYAIESALENMKLAWSKVQIETVAYRDTGSHVCKISDDVGRLLDDHITMTQSMAFSPFKKPFAETIAAWDLTLRISQDVVEAVLECQRYWMYLEPVFGSPDIVEQLPSESRKFTLLDKMWKRTMSTASTGPLFLEFCDSKKLLTTLEDAVRAFEQISKSLTSYLDSKRLAFPRFFFLSDDELLQILSQTKTPTSVQPHLRKCFENIQSLVFESSNVMTAMVSADGETIPFAREVVAKGNVEVWLKEVEDMMKLSVKTVLQKAIVAYMKTERPKWVLDWPGQVVIAGSQIFWTQLVEAAIMESSSGGLKKLVGQLSSQLLELVLLVRQDLPKIARLILSDLIVIDVHARDVVQNLVDANVTGVDAYEWISQLRYYWSDADRDLTIRIMNDSFGYGYEYLGNTGRLVITPLTDRCYLTLCLAMGLTMGGAPAGPAGTGKTETTKDLAKALAKQCVVFNCSDGLDYIAMAKFFKGLASAGAWACFDEFNRINLEVLSVVAQQVSTIQRAIMIKAETFTFEGTDLKLDPTNAIFITMNPGYAGRSELPDNLKALFRPVAMMIPNYQMIAEISLFSFGFSNARELSEKLVATFRLSSELLSSQDHYDFGMRAVKAVISCAGSLKRQYPESGEDLLVLRALSDCNLPKFLANDIPLFDGILRDLFPESNLPISDYPSLNDAINFACKQLGLQPTNYFTSKCIQLFETTRVRHGLMLVGPAGGGKTSCYQVLAKALSSLKGKMMTNDEEYQNIQVDVLNPKSITSGQLYGEFDNQTHEWTDGIVPTLIRQGVEDSSADSKWYVFDGPVDAMWIESMNTVLDDNKKLCLTSGEIIKLIPTQKMIFEVDNLAHASPATVSRCGMVFLEPDALGIEPILTSWFEKALKIWEMPGFADFLRIVREKVEETFTSLVKQFRANCKESYETTNGLCANGFASILESILSVIFSKDDARIDFASLKIDDILAFAFSWSFGATLAGSSRNAFNDIVKSSFATSLHKDELIFDYLFDAQKQSWVSWAAVCEERSNGLTRLDYVPTIETCRYEYLLHLLTFHNRSVLLVGNTGTGKTSIVAEFIRNLPENFQSFAVNFSAQTTANQTQDLIDARLTKRRKGVYGPPVGQKMVIFVDDVNMPAAESTGTQPPIELLRQQLDYRGWYDRQQVGKFNELLDVNFICAMSPSGGGKPLTTRFKRHFNIFYLDEIEEVSLLKIYDSVFGNILQNLKREATGVASKIVRSSINVFKSIRKELLPTPFKSHYVFNLRDLSKVFRGIMLAKSSIIESDTDLVRFWAHENYRVFHDRLVDEDDRGLFKKILEIQIEKEIGLPVKSVFDCEVLLFGGITETVTEAPYEPVKDLLRLKKFADDSLESYNSSHGNLNMVFFPDALGHLMRIARVIRQPEGHALLLGVGGSGKQSLAKMAAFILRMTLSQIEISKNYGVIEWREDLKKLLITAGVDGQNSVFLYSDSQIIADSCLEDVNSIMNSGMVPNLFKPEEIDRIMASMKIVAASLNITKTSRDQLFSLFVSRVRIYLRIVICMSPGSDLFRSRLRMFPALVNCSTINWFPNWSNSSLRSVASSHLSALSKTNLSDKSDRVVDVLVSIHEEVQKESIVFKAKLGRINHVTPKSFLELLISFRKLLIQKNKEISDARNRLSLGLGKLLTASEDVRILKEELAIMQPKLIRASEETEQTMIKISAEKETAEKIRETIVVEEKAAGVKAEETQVIKDDAERDLSEALPALELAVESLKCLTKSDIVEVRSMQRPPEGVKIVIEAVCIMKQIKPKKVDNDKGRKVDDYWDAGKAILSDPAKFLDSLMNFDKENIPDVVIVKIKPYIDNESFSTEAISRVSKAATSMCQWVRAMYKYHEVSRTVEPKRERLRAAQVTLDETLQSLAISKAQMHEIEISIADMESKFKESLALKGELGRKVEDCKIKLVRSAKLIEGLAEEKIRWAELIELYDRQLESVIGDTLLSSGVISYLGPFTSEFRRSLIAEFSSKISEMGIKLSGKYSFVDSLGDPIVIRDWESFGLPKDTVSRENALICTISSRWPLFIDPQGQANKWIRNMEASSIIEVLKLSSKDFLRSLENCIRFGKPCLLENVGETLDAALEPIILKQTFKQGNSLMIKLGENIVPFHSDFRLYLTTKLASPRFSPEMMAKVTVINFTLAPSGLEDQLLGIVAAYERPDLESVKNEIVLSNAAMRAELKRLQDEVLYLLSSVKGSPVDDERLIDTLSASKKTSSEIVAKMKIAELTEAEIDTTRNKYIPVAKRARILFFTVCYLASVDPMYQYSLDWFLNLFNVSLNSSEKSGDLSLRLTAISDHFTFALYSNVCRSLFERHKVLFAVALCSSIQLAEETIEISEWQFLVTSIASSETRSCPQSLNWITPKQWQDMLALACLRKFQHLEEEMTRAPDVFHKWMTAEKPEEFPISSELATAYSKFRRMLIYKCLRPDRLVPAAQIYVNDVLGKRFIEPQTVNFSAALKDASPKTPILFVLSSGVDPAQNFYKLANELQFSSRTGSISLGQGQGPRAEALLREGMEKGMWILLQNVHLSPSWTSSLERIIDGISVDRVHPEFQLWLTSMPTAQFPISILQNSVKVTMEPPRGVKANLLRTYASVTDSELTDCSKSAEYASLFYALSTFHAVIIERKKYGPLGWNIPYEFTDGDLSVCRRMLREFLNKGTISFKALSITTAQIQYGGRITDSWDRRLIQCLINDYYNADVLKVGHEFSQSKIYKTLPISTATSYVNAIKALPLEEPIELFNLDANAKISHAQMDTSYMLDTLLSMTARGTGNGNLRVSSLETSIDTLLATLPRLFDLNAISDKQPPSYNDAMPTVLVQEAARFNRLLSVIRSTLTDAKKALGGLLVMSEALESVCAAIGINAVPNAWNAVAYPSLKPLSAWFPELKKRCDALDDWTENGTPTIFWLPGFFFPQAFLTAVLQNYARKHSIAIDKLSFSFSVLAAKPNAKPEDGCYINGLFLEGARWDSVNAQMATSKPHNLFEDMPTIWLIPELKKPRLAGWYECPLYKTTMRAGTLSTTGHSTNFVIAIELKTDRDESFWIKRGVALFCSLSY